MRNLAEDFGQYVNNNILIHRQFCKVDRIFAHLSFIDEDMINELEDIIKITVYKNT